MLRGYKWRQSVVLLSAVSLMGLLQGCSKGGLFATDPDNRSLSRKSGGEVGGTVTYYVPGAMPSNIKPFVRTGIYGRFEDDQSASFQNFGGGLANGSAKTSHSWAVPTLAGVSIPTSALGVNVPGLTAEVFGGGVITRRKASLSLTEAAAPAGPGTAASGSWTTFDPAVGVGLQYYVGNINNQPVTIGPSVMVDWTRSHVLSALSANFPATETYILHSGNRTETRAMLNINVGIDSNTTIGASGGWAW